MTDYEKLLEETEKAYAGPECPTCGGQLHGIHRLVLCRDNVYRRCSAGDVVVLAAALREVMAERDAALRLHNEAEGTLEMERTIRAEAERDLVSARAALHERGSAPLAEHEDMGRWKRLPVWAQQELEQWRRNEAHQRGLAEAALSDVEAMRALLLDADEALTGSVAAYPESDVCRRIRSALDARATPPASHRCPGCNAEHRGEYDHCETCRARIATPSGGKGRTR